MLNGQDIVVLLKLAGQVEDWTVRSLEADLGIPRAGVHRSLQRLSAAEPTSARPRSSSSTPSSISSRPR